MTSTQPWKYCENLCVLCEIKSETMTHFMNCVLYRGIPIEDEWKQILTNNTTDQFRIAENIRNRHKIRNKKI